MGNTPLAPEAIANLLAQLQPGWELNTKGHLQRNFLCDDFMVPIRLANQIAEVAEAEGHHPDLHISWGNCGVEIWTHKIDGLTESDFILAAKIDALDMAV